MAIKFYNSRTGRTVKAKNMRDARNMVKIEIDRRHGIESQKVQKTPGLFGVPNFQVR